MKLVGLKKKLPEIPVQVQVTARGYNDSIVKLTDIDKIDMPVEASTLAQLCDVACQLTLQHQVR